MYVSNRCVKVTRLPVVAQGEREEDGRYNFIEVSVRYDEGGINYATYKQKKRGFYLSVQPIEDKGDGCVSFMAFSGMGDFIEEAARYNEKKLIAHAKNVINLPNYKAVLAAVLEQQGLKLKEESA